VITAAAVFIAWWSAFGWAAQLPSADKSVWFSGLSAAAAFLTLVAAVGAVWVALPGYRDWLREQRARAQPMLTLEAPNPTTGFFEDLVDRWTTTKRRSIVRVVVHNRGDATLRWAVLNVMVQIACSIEPRDPDEKCHYRSPYPSRSAEISPPEICDVNFTVVERDFPPGNLHLYHVEIDVPSVGEWPVLAVLEGHGAPPTAIRAVIGVDGVH
jgi:hypothetical protein